MTASTLLTNALLIDGTGQAAVHGASVLVEGQSIKTVSPGPLEVPPEVKCIDLGGGAQGYKYRFTEVEEPLEWWYLARRGPRYPAARLAIAPRQIYRAMAERMPAPLVRTTRVVWPTPRQTRRVRPTPTTLTAGAT